jgi:hypothetical protein
VGHDGVYFSSCSFSVEFIGPSLKRGRRRIADIYFRRPDAKPYEVQGSGLRYMAHLPRGDHVCHAPGLLESCRATVILDSICHAVVNHARTCQGLHAAVPSKECPAVTLSGWRPPFLRNERLECGEEARIRILHDATTGFQNAGKPQFET